jgi:hypothetical protein
VAANSVYFWVVWLFLGGQSGGKPRPGQIAARTINRLLAKRRQRSTPASDEGGSASVDLGERIT